MKASKKEFIVTIEGIPGTWRAFTGGNATAEVTRDRNGGAERADLIGGPPDFEDIEVTRTYDPVKDRAWVDRLIRLVGRGRFTVSKFDTDVNFTILGKPRVYPDSLLNGLTEPESDANSSDLAELVLTFATAGPV